MIKEILDETKEKLTEVSDSFKKELAKFRTGRASISMLDGISVDYYGTPTPINQVATLSVQSANLIIIQPWDNSVLNNIDKAIRTSNVDLNPVSDGKTIKLPIPPLDQQRRLDIIKKLKKYLEERKAKVRNIRKDSREMIKLMKDDKEISEDDEKRAYDEVQKLVDAEVKELDNIAKTKEKHILDD